MPDMQQFASSTIRQAGHDPDSGELHVTFDNGTYIFFGVPPDVFDAMQASPSAGQFFAQMIRGQYQYRKIS